MGRKGCVKYPLWRYATSARDHARQTAKGDVFWSGLFSVPLHFLENGAAPPTDAAAAQMSLRPGEKMNAQTTDAADDAKLAVGMMPV